MSSWQQQVDELEMCWQGKLMKQKVYEKASLQNIKFTKHQVVKMSISCNRTVHIRHWCKKTTVLNCHRCLVNTGVEKLNNI